jgi:hypothetical protein
VKRPGTDRPLLGEHEVVFTTAQPATGAGRDVGASTRVPWWVDRAALDWREALPQAARADWVSLDLDYFQPAAQFALTRGLLGDPRYHERMAAARVRVFVLSPQFARGGDVLQDWRVGGRHAGLRMLNLLRAPRPG